jgi:peptide/nickel transport system permease protein
LPTIIVWGTLGISTTVLLEATLSYLGIGVQPPGLVGQHHLREPDLFSGRALAGVLSGAAILALALAFNLVGDALRDILDPTQRGRA